jgi:hypothetical protein
VDVAASENLLISEKVLQSTCGTAYLSTCLIHACYSRPLIINWGQRLFFVTSARQRKNHFITITLAYAERAGIACVWTDDPDGHFPPEKRPVHDVTGS